MPALGARPLRRVIESELEAPLAEKIVSGEISQGDTAIVDADEYGIIISKE